MSIGTNGTLINEKMAFQLKTAGLKKAIVSLDGTEKVHDKIRGKGSYKKTINAINNLEKQHIDVRINSVIMRSNMDDIISLAKILNKQERKIFIRRFIESGRGVNLDNNTLTAKDYDYVREKLSCELKNANFVYGHYLRNNDKAYERIELPFKYIEGCKAGSRALIVYPNGDIHLCGFLAAQEFPPVGNINNVTDWRKYWNDIHAKDYLGDLREKLEVYNQIPKIQKTNCLAYVQNYITRGILDESNIKNT